MVEESACRESLRQLIVRALKLDGVAPESITDEMALFGGGLELDSIDALELMVAVEKEFGIKVKVHEMDRSALANVTSLARFIVAQQAAAAGSAGA